MQVFCYRARRSALTGIAARAVGGDNDLPRGGAVGHASHNELIGTDDDRAVHLAKTDFGAAQLAGTKAGSNNADLASGQSTNGINGLDVRLAVHVFCARFAFHQWPSSLLVKKSEMQYHCKTINP